MPWFSAKQMSKALVFAALVAVSLCSATRADESERIDRIFNGIKPAKPLPSDLKSFDQMQSYDTRSVDDIRQQKEEAADSLNRTRRELDERARTKALEDGKAIIVQ